MIPGWSQSAAQRKHQMEPADRYHVIAPDIRGHGEPTNGDYGWEVEPYHASRDSSSWLNSTCWTDLRGRGKWPGTVPQRGGSGVLERDDKRLYACTASGHEPSPTSQERAPPKRGFLRYCRRAAADDSFPATTQHIMDGH